MIPKIPLLIDTDFGGDPDDIIALLYALNSPEVNILGVITSDEYKTNLRALSVKNFLDSMGAKLPVFFGKDLGNHGFFLRLHTKSCEIEPLNGNSKIEKLLTFLSQNKGFFLAIGGLTNISYLLKTYPTLVEHIPVRVMGGALNYRKKGIAEHNIRIDINAAKSVFSSSLQMNWVLSDITFHNKLLIDASSSFYKIITSRNDLASQMIRENMEAFYKYSYPNSYLHDPITFASIFLPCITFKKRNIVINKKGEFILSEEGKETTISSCADYDLFLKDFTSKCLDPLILSPKA